MTLDPRRHAFRPDLADASLAGQVVATRFVAGIAGEIVAPATALRRHPARDAPLESEALAGEAATIFETRPDGWSWVQLARDRHVGYVETVALAPPGAAHTHRLRVPRTLVYPAPDIKTPPVSWLPLGARFAAAPHDARFLRLARGGYVVAVHAVAIDAPAPDDFVAIAESFLAIPYLWGGRTGLGIDCSGLVQTALDACGLPAPRDSDMQEAELGTAINDRSALRRGDLIFWKGHVGMMRDAHTLLHANGHHMQVASEPLAEAEARTAQRGGGPITAIKRL